jgi:hypothetical protein
LLEERNGRQEDFAGLGVAGTGELVGLEVFRLKRLKERLGLAVWSCDDSLSAGGGGAGGEGASSIGNCREKSKLELLIGGIVFRLSENAKKEVCGDGG